MDTVHLLHILNLFANALVLGGVFMNVFIVWPTALDTLGRRGFPIEFLAIEGRRIAPRLYGALLVTIVTGVVIAWLRPPQGVGGIAFALRVVTWLGILCNTLYGTFRTWPALQFATDAEALSLWRGYARRGRVTFLCATVSFILGAAFPPTQT